jgi:hypothetical protein
MKNNERITMDFDDSSGFKSVPMRVYLAGPLTNNDLETNRICESIRLAAREILREYFEVYDPAEVTPPGSSHSSEEVYLTDHTSTRLADLVLFHVNSPSLGVGIESQIAAEATIPRVIAYHKGAAVSRMFQGVFSPTIGEICYLDVDDFVNQLRALMPKIIERVQESSRRRSPVVDCVKQGRLGREIFKLRIVKNMPIAKLAELTDTREYLLRKLERNDDLAGCLSLIQLIRIAEAIGGTFAMGSGGGSPSFYAPEIEQMDDLEKDSLGKLESYVTARKDWVDDDRVFEMWSEYRKREVSPLAARNKARGYSVQDWEVLYQELYGRLF